MEIFANMNIRTLLKIAVFPLAALLTGCGGAQDYGGITRSLGGDIGTGYNTSLSSRYNGNNGLPAVARGTYPMIETSFELASVPGNPFDYEKVNVQVTLRKPDGGTADVPAFFDGGTTWRMRYTPAAPGQYAVVGVKLNREVTREEKLDKKEWTVNGDPQPGFVRIDRGDHSRFIFDNGNRYYPLGHNQAWPSEGLPGIPTLFGKMHEAGENWSRVWMTAWGGLNLDLSVSGKPVKLGDIDLEVAKRWDAIVQAAEKNDIYFQMTLQHHGQYASKGGYKNSSNVDPNWESNPYNEKNGGFLRSPDDFFINPQARALTRRKLYYILARWGYSPNIMAFELFNEVENTDAAKGRLFDDIAMWHKEMSLFLRQFDGNRHLVTTSAAPGMPLDNPVWQPVDYIQTHLYPPDIITALSSPALLDARKLDKPNFVGEFGPSGLNDADGVHLHSGLWTSLMRSPAGAAQYWSWEEVEKHDLYSHFKAAAGFLTASGLANQSGLTSVTPAVESSQKGDLRFGPGGGWGDATLSEFVVGASGTPAGIGAFPAYLQGQAHRAMMPKPLTFQVSYTQPGTFSVTVGQIAKAGANLKVSVDGKAAEREFPAGNNDYVPKAEQETLTVDVPVGAHTITVENTGKDWLVLRQFSFSNYAPALAALGSVGKEFAAAWVYHRSNLDAPANRELTPATGRLSLTGLQKGRYRATWWDTRAGRALDSTDLAVADAKTGVALNTPPVTRDVALYVVRAGTPPSGSIKGKKASVAREDLKKTLSTLSNTTPPATSTDTTLSQGPQ
jgi:hypothetical protein